MTPPMARPPAQVLGFNSVPSVSPKFIKGTCVLRHGERNVTSPRPLSPRALYSQETDLSTERQSDISDLEDSCDTGCAKRDAGSDQSEYDRFHGGCWSLA